MLVSPQMVPPTSVSVEDDLIYSSRYRLPQHPLEPHRGKSAIDGVKTIADDHEVPLPSKASVLP